MILLLHIAGSIGFVGAGIGVFANKLSRNVLRGFLAFEIVTGTALSVLNSASLNSYCAKIGIYLAFWLMIEGVLVFRRRSAMYTEKRCTS